MIKVGQVRLTESKLAGRSGDPSEKPIVECSGSPECNGRGKKSTTIGHCNDPPDGAVRIEQ
jgi:hypothetical protein